MTDEHHTHEIRIIVSAHGQPDAVLNREIVSTKASTDGVLVEVLDAVNNDVKARMRPVGDDR